MPEDLYSAETIEAVWQKASIIPGMPGQVWRRDRFGSAIRRTDYGQTDTEFGWVVFQAPAPRGTALLLDRLLPLQWRHAALESWV